MAQSNEERKKLLAIGLRDEVLKLNTGDYIQKWPLVYTVTGNETGKYIIVAVIKVDKDILDAEAPPTKATGLPARSGAAMQSTQKCQCCNGTGITKR